MNDENEWITVNVRKETHKRLADRKIHQNQSFDEVIQELLEKTEEA